MKTKSIVVLVLLFVMSLSIIHEFTFAYLDDDHCSTTEYVSELEGPIQKGDICDIHYEYHHAFLQPQYFVILDISTPNFLFTLKDESYLFKNNLEFFRPPIA